MVAIYFWTSANVIVKEETLKCVNDIDRMVRLN